MRYFSLTASECYREIPPIATNMDTNSHQYGHLNRPYGVS